METNTQESGWATECMASVNMPGQMGGDTLDSTKTAKNMEPATTFQPIRHNTMASSSTTRKTDLASISDHRIR